MQQPNQPDPFASPRVGTSPGAARGAGASISSAGASGAVAGGASGPSGSGGAGQGTGLREEDRAMLEEAVDANFLFANMSDHERHIVFEAMQKVPVKVGEMRCEVRNERRA